MGWVTKFLGSGFLSAAHKCALDYPEVILLAAVIVFLILKGRFRAILILGFGTTLCFANYFLFTQHRVYAIPLVYAVILAAVSIVVLLLLVVEFIQTA